MSNSREMLSMYAEIALGKKKADSHLVTDEATSQQWDKLAASHKKVLEDHPGAFVEIPNDPDL